MRSLKIKKILLVTSLISALTAGSIFAYYDISFYIITSKTFFFGFYEYFITVFIPLMSYVILALVFFPFMSLVFLVFLKISGYKFSEIKISILFFSISILFLSLKILDSIIWQSTFSRIYSIPIAIMLASIIAHYFYYLTNNLTEKLGFFKSIKIFLILYLLFFILINSFLFYKYKAAYPTPDIDFINNQNNNHSIKPNIILLILDTARTDHFPVYGYERNTTPNIDAFAKKSALFQNAVSQAPWTLPSHASMLTGLYPRQHGADGRWEWLDYNFDTLAEILKKNFYYTVAISNNEYFSEKTNLNQGFDKFIFVKNYSQTKASLFLVKLLTDIKSILEEDFQKNLISDIANFISAKGFRKDYSASFTNEIAYSYLDEFSRTSTPFFLMINYMETHNPLGDTQNKDLYLKEINASLYEALRVSDLANSGRIPAVFEEWKISDREKHIMNALYDGDLHYLDKKIGEFISFLEKTNLLNNSLVIITSDHGENLGDHGMLAHLYDIRRPLIHVPLLLYYPKIFSEGSIIEKTVETRDIFPTILEIAGISYEKYIDPKPYSLNYRNRPDIAFSEYIEGGDFDFIHPLLSNNPNRNQMIIKGEWLNFHDGEYEYISHYNQEFLYNIHKDQNEDNNLANQEIQKKLIIKTKLDQYLDNIVTY
jgi:arylsulfatase A-like enzyme